MRQRRRTLEDALGSVLAEQRALVSEGSLIKTVEPTLFSANDVPTSATLNERLGPLLAEQQYLAGSLNNSLAELEQEAKRVAEVMRNAPRILEELDKQFCEATSLTRTDIIFLFIATGLQCLRQYVFASDQFRLEASEGDKLVKKVVPKRWENILLESVPYDAIQLAPGFKEEFGGTGLSGTTHRFRTLGHDPLFGWIFGPVNIITDSLTKSDIITTYSVSGMKISGMYKAGTIGSFNDCYSAVAAEKHLLPVATIRQALHFGSDYFTKQGLPLPVIGTLNNDFAKTLVTHFNVDMYSVMRSAALSTLINSIIMFVHSLFYDESSGVSREVYAVRTRKILSYSNALASASNVIYVAINGYLGNAGALKKLDVGGLLVTIYRLVSDYRYVAQIKKEFLEKEFHKIVMG